MVLLSGCGESMVQWSESMSEQMSDAGKNMGNNIREEGEDIAEQLDSVAQEAEQATSVQSANAPESTQTEPPKKEEKKESSLEWNTTDNDVLSNRNIKYAVQLLTDNVYEFSEYTYAEQFDKLTRSPSDRYGEIISIAGTVTEISPVTEDYDANNRTTLYADGIRSILIVDVQGSSNANNRSMLVYSTQTHDKFLLDAEYSISGFLVGTAMYRITVKLQGQTETNHVELPAMVPDKELIYPMPYEEYIYGYFGAYEDEEFLKRMMDELHN
jgi:hypothetical protein